MLGADPSTNDYSGVTCGSRTLPICAIGEGTDSCWKPAVVPGGTQTKLACHRPPSKLPEDGSSFTTECGTRLPAVYIDWDWLSSLLRTRRSACCEEIRGSLDRKRRTSGMATWTMLCFLAGTQWKPMAIRSTFTTE